MHSTRSPKLVIKIGTGESTILADDYKDSLVFGFGGKINGDYSYIIGTMILIRIEFCEIISERIAESQDLLTFTSIMFGFGCF